ncbi:uncharacterized protein UV8b_01948 [Ustilaginoidea virens]|uniref:Uncharacterized protein n=1 Tax=Ustilaginoidea virens TaxID=1159556 RepID=A0A8E5MFP6_USTVR|nr:uncharacterized protein UV8b_01948 [Ustilaginoidea virens]QUC17707.1 hypothetical protein UV8b_01948 [Ustilaginoidea virens]
MAGVPRSSQTLHEINEPVTPSGSSSSRRFGQDNDKMLAKLTDQAFNPKTYPDPLVPRQGVDPQLYPPGTTLDMEKKWLARIKQWQASRI